MTPEEPEPGRKNSAIDRDAENQKLLVYLYETLESGKAEVGMLHRKLAYSYWISVSLSILMFLFGLLLLSVPVMAVVWGKGTETEAAISGTLGIVDLVALFLIGPLNRIHKLMGNIAQVTIAIQSFQNQVALRLLQLDKDDRESIGKAAEFIDIAARENIILIQTYFEETPAASPGESGTRAPASGVTGDGE